MLFGFTIENPNEEEKKELRSFTEPRFDDGAVNIAAGATLGSYVDLDGTVRTEAELVSRYREMMYQSEVDKAVNEIVNEAIVNEEDNPIVSLVMDGLEVGDNIKNIINDEFEYLLDLIEFNKYAYDIFKRWYVDGRSYYHVIINEKNPKDGIKELRYIDPRKIRKVRQIKKDKDERTSITLTKVKAEYFIYNEKGFDSGTRGFMSQMGTRGIRISKDAIIHTTSGLMDKNNTMVLSYLHTAIKPLNILKALEDSTMIYHLSRAPERRIFKVDVGGLPTMKAEQHLRNLMTRYKNKVQYNQTTGEITDNRKFQTMIEDYWLPTRDGRGTDISVLDGGTQLPQLLETVQYFQDRLYNALQVPLTRMKPDAIYNLGRATEITRDEVNFSKFIDRVRSKFSEFLLNALGKQLILKSVTTSQDWDLLKGQIKFKFARDNYFTELKDQEISNERLLRARDAVDFVGTYISAEWVRRHIFRMTDEQIEEEDKRMRSEQSDPRFQPPEPEPSPDQASSPGAPPQ